MQVFLFLFTLCSIIDNTKVRLEHEFHVSTTVVEWRKQSDNLEIYMKIFYDDFTSAIPDHQNNKDQIKDYFTSHFYFEVEGKRISPEYVGKERESDQIFVYFLVKDFKISNTIYVYNTVLFEHFEDQSNIVNFSMNGEIKSAFLNKAAPKKPLKFDG